MQRCVQCCAKWVDSAVVTVILLFTDIMALQTSHLISWTLLLLHSSLFGTSWSINIVFYIPYTRKQSSLSIVQMVSISSNGRESVYMLQTLCSLIVSLAS